MQSKSERINRSIKAATCSIFPFSAHSDMIKVQKHEEEETEEEEKNSKNKAPIPFQNCGINV